MKNKVEPAVWIFLGLANIFVVLSIVLKAHGNRPDLTGFLDAASILLTILGIAIYVFGGVAYARTHPRAEFTFGQPRSRSKGSKQ